MVRGTPTSHTVLYKDPSINGNPSFTSDASSVDLTVSFTNDLPNGIYEYSFDVFTTADMVMKVFLYGECGGTGYDATTKYKYWDFTGTNKVKQDDVNGGYSLRAYGSPIHMEGLFRSYGKRAVNYGRAYTLGDNGNLFDFLVQEITAVSSEPKLLGLSMSWVFENETASRGITLGSESYFSIAKVQTI